MSRLLLPAPLYAAPIALRCWKHSRQKTGRPCVGRKGTVVSFPHCEQLGFVFEAFVGKKHLFAGGKYELSTTLRTLQHLVVVFHEPLSLVPCRAGEWADFAPEGLDACGDQYPGTPGADPLGLRARS